MKKIYFILIILVLTICGCKNKVYTVTLNEDELLNEFIKYETLYELEDDSTFTFPTVEPITYISDEFEESNDKVIYKWNKNMISFVGWKNENGDVITESNVKVNKDETYVPVYTINTTTKTINLVNYGIDVKLQTNQDIYTCTIPIIDDENYIFGGWFKNELFKGNSVEIIDSENFQDGITLYAKISPKPEYVENLINDLPNELTIYDIEEIEFAYETYQLLTYQEKQKITNYDKLKQAYSEIDNLKAANELYYQVLSILEKEITADLKFELEILTQNLENIDVEVEKHLPEINYEKLNDILQEANNLYNLYVQDAKEFDKKIAKIPLFVEQYYINEIKTLKDEYDKLNLNVRLLINAAPKLDTLCRNVLKIESQPVIYYYGTTKTNNVYQSKHQLFNAFFSDFYYYILAYHGSEHLKKNKINNVDDFVSLACNFNGAGVSNLYGIGNLAGRYMLEKDVNGILENQTDNAFFGFCYQNNLYQDLLPFFINFFAYWRIDEKYANTSNYGADIFAESWAPTVDIAKFFYYDENTSYVKTDRMIDCLTNISSVVYNFDTNNSSLPSLTLRGYIFDGWYDNPEFNGLKLTVLDGITKKVYAKWIINQEDADKDAANLVDIYIYNLTTTKATVNEITVGYVKKMFDELSEKGKKLVQNYSTLEKLIEENL